MSKITATPEERQAAYDALVAERVAEAADRVAAVLAIDPQDYIGKVIDYDPQPFGPRKVRINSMAVRHYKSATWPYTQEASWVIQGTVVEGHSVSRLGAHSRARDITGDAETIYGVSPYDLDRMSKTTAYCG